MTVHRVNGDGAAVPSAEPAQCAVCKTDGLRGDFPDEGGIVPDASGRPLCDFCAGMIDMEDAA
jgi:hypothetical protein